MRIRIIRNTVCSGKAVEIGDVLDVPEGEALLLMRMGKAERAIDAEEKAVLPRGEKRSKKDAQADQPTGS